MIREEWRDIPNYKGAYQVSNYGNVKSFKYRPEGNLLKLSIDKGGYLSCTLYDFNKKTHSFKVHRLVGFAFIPNPLNLLKINHIDGNRANNCVLNLEWCDDSHNNKHRHVLNPDMFKGENAPHIKYSTEQILDTYNLAWEGKLSYSQISDKCGVNISEINLIKYGKQWSSVTKHTGPTHSKRFSGEENKNSKLSSVQVLEIYNLAWNSDLTNVEIGRRFNINPENVRAIKVGITWNQVTNHPKHKKSTK